jgi:enamine deaminase RidA (YjgF/YER057c/UK114 family)
VRFRPTAVTGDRIIVAGMVGRDPAGQPIAGAAAQAARAVDRVTGALEPHGAGLADVVRLRVYLRDVAEWPAVLAVLSARFDDVLPPSTVVGGVDLVESWMAVEVEVEAAVRTRA